VFPIGELDDDPTEVITFHGHLAVAAKKTGPRRRRADVTIQFFRLNTREELLRERAEVVVQLDGCLGTINSSRETQAKKQDAKGDVAYRLQPGTRHSACANAFARLYRQNFTLARSLAKAARAFLKQLK
jgi:hypothetical protein